MTDKLKIFYIIGPTRSGSTLFSNILNEVEGFFNAGELIEYWDRGLSWPCSCGTETRSCDIWKNVIRGMNLTESEYARIGKLVKKHSHSSLVPKYLLRREFSRNSNEWSQMLSAVHRLYTEVQKATGSEIVIDSSKNPAYAFLLSFIPDIDLYLVHLIRDSRAVAYSWQRKKMNLWQTNLVETSLVWMLRDSVAEMVGNRNGLKYLKLHYEHFISSPGEAIEAVFRLVGVCGKTSPIENKHYAMIGINHGLCGNPVRFDSGLTRLELDRRYIGMKVIDMMIVTLLTLPALLKYGYPLRPEGNPIRTGGRLK